MRFTTVLRKADWNMASISERCKKNVSDKIRISLYIQINKILK
jgi:hypothetical protein